MGTKLMIIRFKISKFKGTFLKLWLKFVDVDGVLIVEQHLVIHTGLIVTVETIFAECRVLQSDIRSTEGTGSGIGESLAGLAG